MPVAELLRRVEQSGGQACLVLGDSDEAGDRDGAEGKGGACTGEERPRKGAPVVAVHGDGRAVGAGRIAASASSPRLPPESEQRSS